MIVPSTSLVAHPSGDCGGGGGCPLSLAYCSWEEFLMMSLTFLFADGTRGSDRVPSEATGRWGVLAGL